MKYKTLAEIEVRKAAILQEMEAEGADLDALKTEMEELRKGGRDPQADRGRRCRHQEGRDPQGRNGQPIRG